MLKKRKKEREIDEKEEKPQTAGKHLQNESPSVVITEINKKNDLLSIHSVGMSLLKTMVSCKTGRSQGGPGVQLGKE